MKIKPSVYSENYLAELGSTDPNSARYKHAGTPIPHEPNEGKDLVEANGTSLDA